jgi:hypothetical protein
LLHGQNWTLLGFVGATALDTARIGVDQPILDGNVHDQTKHPVRVRDSRPTGATGERTWGCLRRSSCKRLAQFGIPRTNHVWLHILHRKLTDAWADVGVPKLDISRSGGLLEFSLPYAAFGKLI